MTWLPKISLAIALAAFSAPAFGEYNANISGRITSVATYSDAPWILFKTNDVPSGPCSEFFVIPAEVPADQRHQLLSLF